MIESNNLNESDKALLQAIAEYIEPVIPQPVYKLMYDPISGKVVGRSQEDVPEQYNYLIISKNEFDKYLAPDAFTFVEDGKIVRREVVQRAYKKRIVPGTTFYTDDENILLILSKDDQNVKGWDIDY